MTSQTNRPSPLSPAERALKDSLDPPDFRDVHLYAFSRRTIHQDGSIRIGHPLPIIAVGSVLKDTEHFSKLLTSGFAEANTGHDGENTIRQDARESEYDYESDSDLDQFEEVEDMRTPVGASTSSTKGKSKELEQDGGGSESPSTETDKKSEKVHRVVIGSFAYRTLKACIFYLYTNKVNFLPLTSKGHAERPFTFMSGSSTSTFAPACSPKSMYRLAEAYGIKKLQDLAYDEIISQLNIQNILLEAFSSFSSRYPRLREHAVSYISQNYSSPTIQEALPALIERIVAGDMPHAGDVLRSLLGLRIALTSPPRPGQASWGKSSGHSSVPFDSVPAQTAPAYFSAREVSTFGNASPLFSGLAWGNYASNEKKAREEEAEVKANPKASPMAKAMESDDDSEGPAALPPPPPPLSALKKMRKMKNKKEMKM